MQVTTGMESSSGTPLLPSRGEAVEIGVHRLRGGPPARRLGGAAGLENAKAGQLVAAEPSKNLERNTGFVTFDLRLGKAKVSASLVAAAANTPPVASVYGQW